MLGPNQTSGDCICLSGCHFVILGINPFAWENRELELKISLNKIIISNDRDSRRAFVFSYPNHAIVPLYFPLQNVECFTALSLSR